MTTLRRILLLGLLAGLAGCGFQLRGQAQLPFESAYIVSPADSPLRARLARSLTAGGKQLSTKAGDAQVIIRLEKEIRTKEILALSGGGKVREYRLRHQVELSVQDKEGRDLLVPSPILATRDFSYSDEQLLAKEAEEALLFRDMEQDILSQIQRRLAYIKR